MRRSPHSQIGSLIKETSTNRHLLMFSGPSQIDYLMNLVKWCEDNKLLCTRVINRWRRPLRIYKKAYNGVLPPLSKSIPYQSERDHAYQLMQIEHSDVKQSEAFPFNGIAIIVLLWSGWGISSTDATVSRFNYGVVNALYGVSRMLGPFHGLWVVWHVIVLLRTSILA